MAVTALVKDDFKVKGHVEAARFFGKKTALKSWQFEQLSAANRARAFRIAGVERLRLVQQVRNFIKKAIEDGTPWRDVLNKMEALFGTAGVPKPSLARLRTVYRSNTLHAYAVARNEVLNDPEVVRGFPFRQYLSVGNGRPGVNNVRDVHAGFHAKIFRHDDPFWAHFSPPWEWGCRCFVVALTAGQVGRKTVWTYKGGALVPVAGAGKGKPKRLKAKPHPDFDFPRDSFDGKQFDLKGLDAALQRIAKEITK
jgi:hypothetical protein